MVRKIAEAIKMAPSSSRPWSERVVLGCWGVSFFSFNIHQTILRQRKQPEYFPLCDEYLPDFPTALICTSVFSARHVLRSNNKSKTSFNTLIKALQGPTFGYNLLDDAHTVAARNQGHVACHSRVDAQGRRGSRDRRQPAAAVVPRCRGQSKHRPVPP